MSQVRTARRSPLDRPSWASFSRSLAGRRELSWLELDPFLDGGASSYQKDAKRLMRRLDRLGIRVAPVGVGGEADSYEEPFRFHRTLKSDGVRPYERELERLPRLSRAGEFRMARRYEFLRMRAAQALRVAGFAAEDLRERLLQGWPGAGEQVVWPARAARDAALRERVEARLDDLETLRNTYLEGALYIVMKGVHRYRGLGIDTPDLIQEGNYSLFQAIEGFDWRRKVRFKTYAEYWVTQAFLKVLYNGVRTVRVPVWVQKAVKRIKDVQAAAVLETGEELSHAEVGAQLDMSAERVAQLLGTRRYSVSLDVAVGEEGGARLGDLLESEDDEPVPDQIEDVKLGDRLQEVLGALPERERLVVNMRYGLDGRPPRTLFEVGQLLRVSAERVRQLQEAALGRLRLPRSRERLRPFATV